jgi:hypothetical protein
MSGGWKRSAGKLFVLALFALVLGRTVARAKPFLNWDLLVYMALALEWEESDPLEVHRRTYAAAESELSAPEFRWLTGTGMMKARYEDPAAFHEHLGFFRSRVLYSGLLALVKRTGVPLTRVAHAVSLAAWVLCAVVFLAWTSRHLPFGIATATSILFAHSPPLLAATSYATADGLAAVVLLAGIWAFHERGARLLGGTLLVLAVLVRTDAIVFVLCWAGLALLLERGARARVRALLATAAAGLVAYAGVTLWAGDLGWWRLFQVSFLTKSLHPAELSSTPDPGVYGAVVSAVLSALPGNGYLETERTIVGSTLALAYAGFVVAGVVLLRRAGSRGPALTLLIALVAATLARWVLFPRLWDRYHVLFYAALPLVLLSAAAASLRPARGEVDVAR